MSSSTSRHVSCKFRRGSVLPLACWREVNQRFVCSRLQPRPADSRPRPASDLDVANVCLAPVALAQDFERTTPRWPRRCFPVLILHFVARLKIALSEEIWTNRRSVCGQFIIILKWVRRTAGCRKMSPFSFIACLHKAGKHPSERLQRRDCFVSPASTASGCLKQTTASSLRRVRKHYKVQGRL